MTLDQLRIFVAVAQRQHMTAAAQALNITQSAASAAIAALEARHQVKLFHRVGRGIELTEAGRMFLDEAAAVLARATAAEAALAELGGLERGALKIVASQTIAAYWLPPIAVAFRRRYPHIALEILIRNTGHAATRVSDGEAELGFVEAPLDDPTLAIWPLDEDRLLLVQADPFGGEAIDAAWLRHARWVVREPGSGVRATFDQAMRRSGVDPEALEISLVLPSNEAVRTAVEAGAGVTALSGLVVGPSLAAGALHALPFDLGARKFYGLRHKERYQSRAAEAFLALVAERTAGGQAPREPTGPGSRAG
jgi:DNA-binding transcriptional LysR family regulator